ncbi:hypothetical protein PG911_07385 [Tenacibaculum ovolyticum]|uniref:GTP pyrophosphokinase n=1 Tax=Tenacibaculum ovolyticum TaxID=104270 RepID=UPI0022F3F4A4|nr:hypothetical protein [Tenacibaculum ovolyticum]WBX78069.1 hypothetical protein PG911_07385 [Tenacibaculum ovolyticum]
MKNRDWYIKNRGLFKKLATKIETILIDILEENNIEYHQVHCRAKTIGSFSKKLENPKYSSADDITDLAGIRIITYVEDSIPKICKIIEDNLSIDKENSHDKSDILGLDKVGYKSVHYVAELPNSRIKLTENKKFKELKFEIQVRTILQHSWAEIEHDRNYKFGGQLPVSIQRRFKLLAGLLELADNEFNSISREIDDYSKNVKDRTAEGDLNIEINSTSLQEYMNQKLTKIKGIEVNPKVKGSQDIVKEIKNYGILNLREFDKIIPKKLFENYIEIGDSISSTGTIRDILIINDYKKYFEKSYDGEWWFTGYEDFEIFKRFGFKINQFEEEIGWNDDEVPELE